MGMLEENLSLRNWGGFSGRKITFHKKSVKNKKKKKCGDENMNVWEEGGGSLISVPDGYASPVPKKERTIKE